MRGLIVLCLMLFPVLANAGRQAMVIGNAAYDVLENLPNALGDARAYRDGFGRLGYDVTYHENLSLDAMLLAIEAFTAGLGPGDDVVFVYSGHGWSDGRTNFLIPTDAPRDGSERQLARASIALKNGVDGVLDDIDRATAGLAVLIIDACRNNPFRANGRSVGLSRGLSALPGTDESFIIYSADNGQVALDRLPQDPESQTMSVFTRHFLPLLEQGRYLEDAITEAQVQTAALARTYNDHVQRPAYSDQTLGYTCLSETCSPRRGIEVRSQCDQLYDEAKAAGQCFSYQAYVDTCGDHVFAPMARAFLAGQCQPTKATAVPEPNTAAAPDTPEPAIATEDIPVFAPPAPVPAPAPAQKTEMRKCTSAPTDEQGLEDCLAALNSRSWERDDRVRFTSAVGGLYYTLGQLDRAAGYYRRAWFLSPDDTVFLGSLAAIYAKQGDTQNMRKFIDETAQRVFDTGAFRADVAYLEGVAARANGKGASQQRKALDTYWDLLRDMEKRRWQRDLKDAGFYTGDVDAKSGPAMRRAFDACIKVDKCRAPINWLEVRWLSVPETEFPVRD
ncbi:caspase family protein [Mesobacterium sp. TK19101]|uniref:Caspase family protein n=1 Tax=Mesobacterium hydrothermale TaxID=3111907 RepID=A0ABU6HJ54_9RHOB|nr:caspase family protein [Mesobacterium sp. TK19101]MEC3861865.1 caspase family protein [Mesobacterium sp. TK19101]